MATSAFERLILAAGLAGTNNGDGTITIDLANAGPGATGPLGDSTHTPIITIDAKGRVTGLTSTAISGAGSTPALVGVKCYATAVQSVANNTLTPVTFDSEEFDTDNFHSTVTNPTRLTIPTGKGGKYLLVFGGFWNSAPGTGGRSGFRKNGATLLRCFGAQGPNVAGYSIHTITVADLAVADYVEAISVQNSGGAINLGHATATDAQSNVVAILLGA